MDNIDKKILEELQKNSSQPLSELSKKVGLSNTPCWNRIKKYILIFMYFLKNNSKIYLTVFDFQIVHRLIRIVLKRKD